jgi:hypothetical protein
MSRLVQGILRGGFWEMALEKRDRQEIDGFLVSFDKSGRAPNITNCSAFAEAKALEDAAKWLIGKFDTDATIDRQQVATVAYFKGCHLRTRAAGAVEVDSMSFGPEGRNKVNEIREKIRESIRIDREEYSYDDEGLDEDCLVDEAAPIKGPSRRRYSTFALQYQDKTLALVRCRVNMPLGTNVKYLMRKALLVSLEQGLVVWIAPFDPVRNYKFNLEARKARRTNRSGPG